MNKTEKKLPVVPDTLLRLDKELEEVKAGSIRARGHTTGCFDPE